MYNYTVLILDTHRQIGTNIISYDDIEIETGKKYILPTIAKTRRGICYYHIMNVWKNMVQIIKLKKHTGRSSIYNRKGSLFRG